MNTLRLFHSGTVSIPVSAAWYLSDLGEFRGKQELYTRQSPQRLKALREHALIESAVSSNRIEGVSVEPSRINDVLVSPRPLFRDRDEEEVRGYRDALAWIHQDASKIPLNEPTIKRLHTMSRGQIWDAGRYKAKDADIVERYPDGAERVSRLLWLLQSYQLGYEVGRYISLEHLVEQNKDRYYETLEQSSQSSQSSQSWHAGKHDPWPYINYVLFIMKMAYREFAERVGEVRMPRGAKREQVLSGIQRLTARPDYAFTISELEQACPGVSRDMVRRVLREQQSAGLIECEGRGPGARWRERG